MEPVDVTVGLYLKRKYVYVSVVQLSCTTWSPIWSFVWKVDQMYNTFQVQESINIAQIIYLSPSKNNSSNYLSS